MVSPYLAIAAGGAIGACSRYALSGVVYQKLGAGFPYGTMVVNIVGCFFIGLAMEATEGRLVVTPAVRLFLTVGLLGGFTTFSTFSLETLNLVRDGFVIKGAMNAVGSLLLGLMAAYAGLVAGRVL